MVASSPYGCSDTVRHRLFIKPVPPIADFGPDAEGCAPVDVVFTNNSQWASSYFWQFGDGTSSTEQNPSHRYSRPGAYTVRLIATGPGGSDTLEKVDIIHVYEMPDARFSLFPKMPRTVRIPEELLEGYVINENPSYTYLWNFGDGGTSTEMDPKHQYKDPGEYPVALTVTTANGCTDTDTLFATVTNNDGTLLKIPNAFSPNMYGGNDGVIDGTEGTNDVFYPVTIGATAIKLQIFNRWGQFLYQSTTLNKGWDGYYQGKLSPADTYVFIVEVRFANGEIKRKVGDVTLVR
jgi:gliding motility-associated-like protein